MEQGLWQREGKERRLNVKGKSLGEGGDRVLCFNKCSS